MNELLQKALEHTSQLHKCRNSQPYDGVAGRLPEWVPEWHKNEFRKIRDKLLDTPLYGEEVSRENIILWMDNYCALGSLRVGVCSSGFIPPEVWDDVGYLAHIRYAVSLDKEKGLLLLAGEQAVKGERFSSGGTSKKGKEYEPKASIRKICANINSQKFDDVLEVLRDAEECAELYESTIDPIGVLFTEVDDGAGIIKYLLRGELPNNQKQITFRRLKNILSEIKNS